MNAENKMNSRMRAKWLRTALLTYTLAGPAINAWMKRARQGSQAIVGSAQALPEIAQSKQSDFRERLEELTRESRQRAIDQAQHLRTQANQLQEQSRQLRKAVRNEAKQRRKLLEQMRESGLEWGQDIIKRGERLTGDLVERGGEVTQDLTKRGRKATRELTRRGEELLKPAREQNPMVWTVIGFGVGLAIAGAITYRLVRGRVIKQAAEVDQAIELPQDGIWNGRVVHASGEIKRYDQNGVVATLEAVGTENADRPADAAFVGVVSTKYYYPADTELEPTDLVYFTSEEEAWQLGFKAAE